MLQQPDFEERMAARKKATMTKDEWIARCAAQYMKRGGLTQEQANEAAGVCFESHESIGENNYTPEDEANEDMDCWTDDGDE